MDRRCRRISVLASVVIASGGARALSFACARVCSMRRTRARARDAACAIGAGFAGGHDTSMSTIDYDITFDRKFAVQKLPEGAVELGQVDTVAALSGGRPGHVKAVVTKVGDIKLVQRSVRPRDRPGADRSVEVMEVEVAVDGGAGLAACVLAVNVWGQGARVLRGVLLGLGSPSSVMVHGLSLRSAGEGKLKATLRGGGVIRAAEAPELVLWHDEVKGTLPVATRVYRTPTLADATDVTGARFRGLHEEIEAGPAGDEVHYVKFTASLNGVYRKRAPYYEACLEKAVEGRTCHTKTEACYCWRCDKDVQTEPFVYARVRLLAEDGSTMWVTVLGASGEQFLGATADELKDLEKLSVSGGDAGRANLDAVVRRAAGVKWTVGVKLEAYEVADAVVASATVFEVKNALKRSAAEASAGAGVGATAAEGAGGEAAAPSTASGSGGRGDAFGFAGAEPVGGFGFGGGRSGEAGGATAAAAPGAGNEAAAAVEEEEVST